MNGGTEPPPACTNCAPCIAQVASPEVRLQLLRGELARGTEPLVALTHLLRLCRDEHGCSGNTDGTFRANDGYRASQSRWRRQPLTR